MMLLGVEQMKEENSKKQALHIGKAPTPEPPTKAVFQPFRVATVAPKEYSTSLATTVAGGLLQSSHLQTLGAGI